MEPINVTARSSLISFFLSEGQFKSTVPVIYILGQVRWRFYLFELFLTKFVLSLLRFKETVELFLLLTLNMLLELLLIIAKCFCL